MPKTALLLISLILTIFVATACTDPAANTSQLPPETAATAPEIDIYEYTKSSLEILLNDNGAVAATVDGMSITEAQVLARCREYDSMGKQYHRRDALDDLVRQQVQLNEAAALGLSATYAEAEQAYNETVAAIRDLATTDPSSQQVLDNLEKPFQAAADLGLSRDQYLDMLIKAQQDIISLNQLYQYYLEHILDPHQDPEKTYQQLYAEYVDQLIAQAEIKYY